MKYIISLKAAKENKLFYVVATAVVVDRRRKKALILKRSMREIVHPGSWGVVGGKLEWSAMDGKPTRINGDVPNWVGGIETLIARETKEESGLSIDQKTLVYLGSVLFVRPDNIPVACLQFGVAAKTTSISIDTNDFDDYAWVDSKEVKEYHCMLGIAEEVKKALELINDK